MRELDMIERECRMWDALTSQDLAIEQWMSQAADSDPLFHRDALASEAAAWTQAELTDALARAGLEDLHHGFSRPPLLQVHWARALDGDHPERVGEWHEVAISDALRRRVMGLRLRFRDLR